MKLFDFKNIFKSKNTKALPTEGQQATILDAIIRAVGFGSAAIMPDDSTSYINNGYLGNPNVYSIISYITQKAGAIPWGIYRIKNEKKLTLYKSLILQNKGLKEQVLEEDTKHPLSKILTYPNELQGWSEFIEQACGFKLLTGNSYLHCIKLESNKLQEMWVLPSQLIEIITGNRFQPILGYRLINNRDIIFSADEIIHLKYWTPDSESQLYGLSPIRAARRVVTRSNASYDMSTNSLQNNGVLGIISSEGESTLTKEQADSIEEKLRQKSSATSRNRWVATGARIKWQQMGLPPVDLQLIENDKMDLRTLCNIYHVPSELFNDATNKTYSNTKEAGKAIYTNAVIPILASFRDELNRWISMNYDENIYIDYDLSMLPELQEDWAALVGSLSQAWWLTPNQRLEIMGWETSEDPLMDKVWIPSGYIPIDAAEVSDELLTQVEGKMKISDYE
ncbi:MAG TPA: phage portal protein [Sedimentibacter sp.]|nr:phage portal protein [Sedimentibacter sp.]